MERDPPDEPDLYRMGPCLTGDPAAERRKGVSCQLNEYAARALGDSNPDLSQVDRRDGESLHLTYSGPIAPIVGARPPRQQTIRARS